MKKLKSYILFFLALSFSTIGCNGQVKDNPAVFKLNPVLRTQFGDTVCKIIEKPEIVKAYHLDWQFEDDRNAKRFHGSKIIDSISRLRQIYVDTLLSIVSNPNNYRFDFVKHDRCAFKPDLGFLFTKGNQKTSLLVTILVCDEMQFMFSNDTSKLFKIDKAHNKFLKLAKDLFPANYRQINFNNPVTITNPVDTNRVINNTNNVVNTDTSHVRNNPIINSNIPKKHKVKEKETLADIAKLYGIKEKDLRDWNKLGKKENPKVGTEILIEKVKK